MKLVGATALATLIKSLTFAHALVYGVCDLPEANIVTKKRLAQLQSSGKAAGFIARDKAHFRWPEGPGLMMFDYDPPADSQALTPEAWRNTLYDHSLASGNRPTCGLPVPRVVSRTAKPERYCEVSAGKRLLVAGSKGIRHS